MNSTLDTLWKGVYRKGAAYKRGEFVTHKGSLWHVNVDNPTELPGTGAQFTLAVKSGQQESAVNSRGVPLTLPTGLAAVQHGKSTVNADLLVRTENKRRHAAVLSRVAGIVDAETAADVLADDLRACGLTRADALRAATDLIEGRLELVDDYLNAAEAEDSDSEVSAWLAGLSEPMRELITEHAASLRPRDVVSAMFLKL